MTVGIDTDFLVRLAILEHPKHQETCELRDQFLDRGDKFALAPQVISEFTHVVCDSRRFVDPLSMQDALSLAEDWWNAKEVDQVFPCENSTSRFFDLMTKHRLGRKRILDTFLAATYLAVGVTDLLTGNPRDYRIFSELNIIEM